MKLREKREHKRSRNKRFGKPDTSQGCEQWPCAQEASSQNERELCYVVKQSLIILRV